ncbi:MAG: transcriptional repressor LexA [Treponema sp.]|jgi:repressor LexA|nr:transcriptional repressor LexA [Treponema sp.]
MKELTGRQKEVLSFIAEYINMHSYPPTIREIAEYFCMSVKGAHDHVLALKRKGCIKQNDKRPRTMKLVQGKEADDDMTSLAEIPLLGTVAAGRPILADENWDGSIMMHRSMLRNNKKYFALKVRGDSMCNAGIMDGDTAIIEKQNVVRNGEIAVAVVDDAVTLKRFYRDNSRIKLQAENPAYKPIYCQDVRILGRLSRIIRFY